jgi:hypothetical protein
MSTKKKEAEQGKQEAIEVPAMVRPENVPPELAAFAGIADAIVARKTQLEKDWESIADAGRSYRRKEVGVYFEQGMDLQKIREGYKQLGLWGFWQKSAGLDDDSVNRWIRFAEKSQSEYPNLDRDEIRQRLEQRFKSFTAACYEFGIPAGGGKIPVAVNPLVAVKRSVTGLKSLEITATQLEKLRSATDKDFPKLIRELRGEFAEAQKQIDRLLLSLPDVK